MKSADRSLRARLFDILCRQFDLEELRTLCWLVDADYDSLRGEGKAAKARELVAQTERRGQLPMLVESGRGMRPEIDWPAVGGALLGNPSGSAVRLTFEPEMVRIPAGEFVMGSDPGKDEHALNHERPQHILYLPEYFIAKTPVTNAQYLPFVQAVGHRPPEHWEKDKPPDAKREHPVVNVSWEDAMAYCRWLAKVTGRPYSLPSEAEWEKGARGTGGLIYPWGNPWDAARCNSREGGKGDTTPVGAYPNGASPYGLLDMAGNVWEWTRSLYKGYPYDPADGREDLDAGGRRVVRGGSFSYLRYSARCAVRCRNPPDYDWDDSGFRVVSSISP